MARTQKLKVLLTCGGTGGHFYPLISVVDELQKKAAADNIALDIRYFGDAGSYADELMGHGVRITHIAASKWRPYFEYKRI